MLTKEQCNEALEHFEKCYWYQDCSYGAMSRVRKDLDILNKLIHEHFSNPPLEWEEIKEGDFVFDKDFNGLGGEWLKVYMKHITIYGEKVLMCGACGSDDAQTRSYKEDRFYRKQVEE